MALRTDHKLFRARAYALENCFVALEETIRDAGFKDVWSQHLSSFLQSPLSGVDFDGPCGAGLLPLNQDHGVSHAFWLASHTMTLGLLMAHRSVEGFQRKQ